MADNAVDKKAGFSTDWLLRGSLNRLGDIVDKFTGRKWTPSSSLAASELIHRIKALLDSEIRQVDGKGKLVPHEICIRMQWDKFSTDSESAIETLRTELLAAVIDHINDSLYYTYSPVTLEIKPDYFTDGVSIHVSFGTSDESDSDAELNVTIPGLKIREMLEPQVARVRQALLIARFELGGESKVVELDSAVGQITTVGRSPQSSLRLDDKSVSKFHASIVIADDGTLAVSDTGSTNGTFIKHERISYGNVSPFAAGDHVTFGTVDVVFDVTLAEYLDEPDADDSDIANRTVEIDGFEFTSRSASDEVASTNDQPPVPDASGESQTSETTSEIDDAE